MDRTRLMPATIVGAAALLVTLGFGFAITASNAPKSAVPAASGGVAADWAAEELPTPHPPSTNPTTPTIEKMAILRDRSLDGWLVPRPVTASRDRLSRSVAVMLDRAATPTVPVDVAGSLLERPEVKAAILRALRAPDLGYPGSAEDPAFVMTTVFRPYGALRFTKDRSRFRLWGVATSTTWRMLGLMPSLHTWSTDPIWVDIEMDGGAHVLEVVDLPSLYLFEYTPEEWSVDDSPAALKTMADSVPGWVVDRLFATPIATDELDEEMELPGARQATARLILGWERKRVTPGMTTALPTPYAAFPHAHARTGSARQLSKTQIDAVFERLKSSALDEDQFFGPTDESQGSVEYPKGSPLSYGDILGPGPGGPVATGFTTYNDIIDFHVLVNTESGRALKVMGFSEFANPYWMGDTLIVDLVLDDRAGPSPTGIHCEIDWKTMTVLRAVPYGPLSPF